jgi:hypothetical protein
MLYQKGFLAASSRSRLTDTAGKKLIQGYGGSSSPTELQGQSQATQSGDSSLFHRRACRVSPLLCSRHTTNTAGVTLLTGLLDTILALEIQYDHYYPLNTSQFHHFCITGIEIYDFTTQF